MDLDTRGWPSHEAWNALAERASNLFSTREWAETWARHYLGDGDEVRVVVDDERSPRVVLPVHRSGRVVRQLKFLGNGPADQLGPVCAPEDRELAAELIRERLVEDPDLKADVVLLQDVPVEHGWDTLLPGTTVVRTTPSPVVRFAGPTWQEHMASMSSNFRSQARRFTRRLHETLPITVRLATPETLEDDLRTLFALHVANWGEDAAYATGVERRFQEDFSRVAMDRGWLRLWVMETEGRPIAALHGYRFAGVDYSYQAGRDPEQEPLRVGLVMDLTAMRAAVEDGIPEYRMLRGAESYKSRYTKLDRPVHNLAYPRTVRGRVATTATTAWRQRAEAREVAREESPTGS